MVGRPRLDTLAVPPPERLADPDAGDAGRHHSGPFARDQEIHGSSEPRHFPVVEFTVPGSTTITVEARTGTSDSAGLRPGTSIGIVYDRRKPEVVVIDSLDPGFTSFGTIAAILVRAIAAACAVTELALEITA
ncbi:hypothetical protein SLA_4536 [Streptomyces laurentii]|uniref:Uncharacterized protein n=1 Tax=Streptomyces laurentii TaxID=39478 RepID=A0A160P4D8_STRLU|nr:hypothetical protein SLA_4536 [Streptomyces laurentii]